MWVSRELISYGIISYYCILKTIAEAIMTEHMSCKFTTKRSKLSLVNVCTWPLNAKWYKCTRNINPKHQTLSSTSPKSKRNLFMFLCLLFVWFGWCLVDSLYPLQFFFPNRYIFFPFRSFLFRFHYYVICIYHYCCSYTYEMRSMDTFVLWHLPHIYIFYPFPVNLNLNLRRIYSSQNKFD